MSDEKSGRPDDAGHSRPSNEDKPTPEQVEEAKANDAELAASSAEAAPAEAPAEPEAEVPKE